MKYLGYKAIDNSIPRSDDPRMPKDFEQREKWSDYVINCTTRDIREAVERGDLPRPTSNNPSWTGFKMYELFDSSDDVLTAGEAVGYLKYLYKKLMARRAAEELMAKLSPETRAKVDAALDAVNQDGCYALLGAITQDSVLLFGEDDDDDG